MAPLGWVIVYAVGLWWVATGIILLLNHLPSRTFRLSLSAATVLLGVSVLGVGIAARRPGITAAYLGFTCALLAWGWQEMTFFMGLITGPRRVADQQARGWHRFWQAIETLLYHEAAIATVGLVIVALSAGRPNQVACWTYLSLWAMRISAKLNVYLGVRNLNENWVPRRLAYLKAYMVKRRMNPLLPVSVTLGTIAATVFIGRALVPHASRIGMVTNGFVGVILALGVVEHLFMVLPLDFARVWGGFAPSCPVAKDLPPITTCPHMSGALPLLPPALERS